MNSDVFIVKYDIMGRGKKIDDNLIKNIIDYHNDGNSLRKTAIKFGVGKTTVLDYTKPKEVKRELEIEKSKKNVIAVKKRRKKLKEKSVEYLGGMCCKCGYNKCFEALEFHHKDPTQKDFGISYKGHTKSWNNIKKELDKCILVCANCHREIHSKL